MSAAVKSYRMLQAALPPAGPQKNVNGPVHSKIIGRFVINLNADTYSKLNFMYRDKFKHVCFIIFSG